MFDLFTFPRFNYLRQVDEMAVQLEESPLVSKSHLISHLESDSEDEHLQLSLKSKKFVLPYSDDEEDSLIGQREIKNSLETENESSSGNQIVNKNAHKKILSDSEEENNENSLINQHEAEKSQDALMINQQEMKISEGTTCEFSSTKSSKKTIFRRTISDDSDSEQEAGIFKKDHDSPTSYQKKVGRPICEDTDDEFSNGEIENQLRLELPMSGSDVSDSEEIVNRKGQQPSKVEPADESSNDSEIVRNRKPKRKSGFVFDENSNLSNRSGNSHI